MLLFQFAFAEGALTGHDYWATPGGAVEPGESFADAARRELFEETGLVIEDVGPEVARRGFTMRLMSGEEVVADERFFLIRTSAFTPSRDGWTANERVAMRDHAWWSLAELDERTAQVWPEDIADMVRDVIQTG